MSGNGDMYVVFLRVQPLPPAGIQLLADTRRASQKVCLSSLKKWSVVPISHKLFPADLAIGIERKVYTHRKTI